MKNKNKKLFKIGVTYDYGKTTTEIDFVGTLSEAILHCESIVDKHPTALIIESKQINLKPQTINKMFNCHAQA